ncbi:hypothetical protein KK083_22220 [Fulvivirgaceae bacterium PWU4]|uniref:Uncharacterized protein n=1 Tax=Chryseosolibacter histidini TaxID=2782349 RepID=A0AAP2DNI2_9BACT|nr:hypothetical protein [Chryseosolibacter histidini]MBT1699631.1 hypothetical protein [Chryseosolibacter histidini]
MSKKLYKVIWCDDQHEKMKGFKMQAKEEGIELVCFKSSEGIKELKANFLIYDGVLLDAKFFETENDATGTESLKALSNAKEEILKLPKVFKPFVLTGQAKLYNDDTFNLLFPNYYRKGIEGDIIQLFADIKREADKQVETQIKHDHESVFQLFASGYLPDEVMGQLVQLLKTPIPRTRFELKSFLVNIRSIHESCLHGLAEIGVIPNLDAPKGDIFRHLSGNKVKDSASSQYVSTTEEFQNDAIENLQKWLYYTCGKYLHVLKDENYNGYVISGYAVESLRSGILELLLWFKQVYKENTQE